ncbi:hypothetical protein ENBRE01_1004 [Enteropsectra breve]|nr:hypothetical protein ENBRE01_1004 [Enteropsectra breve]
MRILLLFAGYYAKTALNSGGNDLKHCSPQQCPDGRAECFSLMLDGFKGKDAIADVNDKQRLLIFTNQKDKSEVLKLYLKSERLKRCIPLLEYFCDCFGYDLCTSNKVLLCSGVNEKLSFIYKENGRWFYPKDYGMLFRKNYLKLIEDDVDISCYYRKDYTEETSVPESKEDIVDIPKYKPASCFCKFDEDEPRGWSEQRYFSERQKWPELKEPRDWGKIFEGIRYVILFTAEILFILCLAAGAVYLVTLGVKYFIFGILGIGCFVFDL